MNTYFENSEIFENFDDEVFSNVIDPNMVIQGVTAVANVGSQVAQAKAQKEATKTEIVREVETMCGKKKGSKKKKADFDKCAKPIYEKYQLDREQQNQIKEQQLRNASIQQEKTKNRNLYIGLGVLAVLIGVVVYFKRTS